MAVEKVYLATKEDLATIKDTKLIVKSPSNSNTIADLSIGDIVKVPEIRNGTTAYHDYIIVEKDDTSTVILRKDVSDKGDLISVQSATIYKNQAADMWLNSDDGFLAFLSNGIKSLLRNKSIKVNTKSGAVETISRQVFIPSAYNLGNTTKSDGEYVWYDTNAERIAYVEGTTTTAFYYTRTCSGQEIGSVTGFFAVWGKSLGSSARNDGELSGQAGMGDIYWSNAHYYRPCLCITNSAAVDSENKIVDGVVYDGLVDTVVNGDKNYKFKDIDAVHLTDVKTPVSSANKIVTENELTDKQDTIDSDNPLPYSYLSGTPTIPTAVSDLTNDAGYQTASDVAEAVEDKQDKLTAGDNITIDENGVISSTGGASVSSYTIALLADDWADHVTSFKQTVSLQGVTPTSNVGIFSHPTNFIEYNEALVRCVGQGTNFLQFEAEDLPIDDLLVNVILWG